MAAAVVVRPLRHGRKTAGAEREQRLENLFLGTKRNVVAECLAREAWPSGDCEPNQVAQLGHDLGGVVTVRQVTE